ncbi:MAG TPA: PIN domain-containing protein [Chloroflexota bacterium]|nr:PIN domain-containing protein [Chloroflexota bacterium]
MGWIDELRGTRVGIDTAPLIYFIEEHPTYLRSVQPFFAALDRGELEAVTSVVTLLEVLVHPLRDGDTQLAQQYRDILLGAQGFTTVGVTAQMAERAALLRAAHTLRTPDAIQLATALDAGATAFLTNDEQLPSLPGLKLLVLRQLTP